MPQMSTDGTNPTDPTPAATEPTTTETPQPTATEPASTNEGTLGSVEEAQPGFITRHTTTLITLMVAVIVAAAAIAGVTLYRHNVDQQNSDTEAAFAKTVSAQGATLETIECDGGTCAAVINGQAYTVLVQEDSKGKQHFGVSAYAGD
jgi:uncharacterized protein HemX